MGRHFTCFVTAFDFTQQGQNTYKEYKRLYSLFNMQLL